MITKTIYYVYILKSLKDQKYYIGQTANLNERHKQHNLGLVKSTKNRIPLEIIYYEEFETILPSSNVTPQSGAAFEAANHGSNPCPPTNSLKTQISKKQIPNQLQEHKNLKVL